MRPPFILLTRSYAGGRCNYLRINSKPDRRRHKTRKGRQMGTDDAKGQENSIEKHGGQTGKKRTVSVRSVQESEKRGFSMIFPWKSSKTLTNSWCRRRDSNPHESPRHPLKMVCLPIPPRRHGTKHLYHYHISSTVQKDPVILRSTCSGLPEPPEEPEPPERLGPPEQARFGSRARTGASWGMKSCPCYT